MKTILSIDGGGVRGIVPAIVLRTLETALGYPLGERFDGTVRAGAEGPSWRRTVRCVPSQVPSPKRTTWNDGPYGSSSRGGPNRPGIVSAVDLGRETTSTGPCGRLSGRPPRPPRTSQRTAA